MMTDKRGCQRRPIKAILLARLPTLLYNPAHHQTLFEKSISSIERVQMLDLAHQLKVISGDTAQNLDLSKQIVIQRTERIVVVDSRDEVHQDHLGISLSSITSFTIACFSWVTSLYDDDHWRSSAFRGFYIQTKQSQFGVIGSGILRSTDCNDQHRL
jgi:hypothetical protein